jgi:alanyl-tRNA synthetase
MATTIELDELRNTYLRFFESKGHLVHPSASLKSDDPTLMFNVAGMQQFKPYFQGATPRFPGFEGVWPRVVTSQKCMRAGGKDSDIENVGRTGATTPSSRCSATSRSATTSSPRRRLGLGVPHRPAWLGLDPDRLWVTVFTDDDEAYRIWTEEVGVPAERVSRFGEAENFWPANAVKDGRSGPCGPCSEIFYDRGPEYGSPDETGPNTGAGDRFMEIWNLVFTQFDLVDGELRPLPMQNIDTGMGFERLASVVSGARDAYGSELFGPSIRLIEQASGRPYRDLESVEHRIIADHARSVTMCITDGILPANDGAGYVIKMLIRRAARQAWTLGVREPLLHRLVDTVAESMGGAYPEVRDQRTRVAAIVKAEEEQFLTTLEAGIERVAHVLDGLDGGVLPGPWPSTCGRPTASRSTSRSRWRPSAASRSTARATPRRARPRARSRAPAAPRGRCSAPPATRSRARRRRPRHRSLAYEALEADATVLALVVDGEPAWARSPRARTRPGGARPHPLLPRGRRSGRRRRQADLARRRDRRDAHQQDAARPRAPRGPRGPGPARVGATVHVASTRRGARPRSTTPPRTCCTPRCGRCSATTSRRRARWSRPTAALRRQPRRRHHARAARARSSGSPTPGSRPTCR